MALGFKPDLTILLRPKGSIKSSKVELFRSTKFGTAWQGNPADKYRIRCDGKWFGHKHTYLTFHTIPEVMELLEKSFEKVLR